MVGLEFALSLQLQAPPGTVGDIKIIAEAHPKHTLPTDNNETATRPRPAVHHGGYSARYRILFLGERAHRSNHRSKYAAFGTCSLALPSGFCTLIKYNTESQSEGLQGDKKARISLQFAG